jgi:hypothetical protein
MNFTDLLAKIKQIDESDVAPPSDPDNPQGMEECGDMPGASNDQMLTGGEGEVTINMSMQDLLALMSKMQGGDKEIAVDETGKDGGFGDATTEPGEEIADISAVTPTGNDLASKGQEAPKVNGGGNPMHEALVAKLSAMYEETKAKKEKEPEGTYSSKRQETDGQRVARLAKEKRQAEKKERMKNDFNAEMER